jgi:hypothetical protein
MRLAAPNLCFNIGTFQQLHQSGLDRLRGVLAVDNAAMLLLTADGQALELHAAKGPEEAPHGQVQVRVGQGVAGHIAASRSSWMTSPPSES